MRFARMDALRSSPIRALPFALGLAAAFAVIIAALPLAGCSTMRHREGRALTPERNKTVIGAFRIMSNEPLPPDSAASATLASLQKTLERELGLRVGASVAPIDVHVLDDAEAFAHFLRIHHPELPPRRAFFLAEGSTRAVYAHQGPNLDEDLRHEGTHALLHASGVRVPLWLDEGLAECYEAPGGAAEERELHRRRLTEAVSQGWTPSLARLEAIPDVQRMSQRDYAESWAWVRELLTSGPEGKTVLLSYLNDLRTRPLAAEPIARRLSRAIPDVNPDAWLLADLRRDRDADAVLAGATIELPPLPMPPEARIVADAEALPDPSHIPSPSRTGKDRDSAVKRASAASRWRSGRVWGWMKRAMTRQRDAKADGAAPWRVADPDEPWEDATLSR